MIKVILVCDVRSPIAQQWVRGLENFAELEIVVYTTTAAAHSPFRRARLFSRLGIRSVFEVSKSDGTELNRRVDRRVSKIMWWLKWLTTARGVSTLYSDFVLPVSSFLHVGPLNALIQMVRPDLVHCLRIPIEGIVGGLSDAQCLIVSVWGNDFTLYARKSLLHRILTRRCLNRVVAIAADCQADIERAREFGSGSCQETLVVPGNGGVDSKVFRERADPFGSHLLWPTWPSECRIILNPRGFRRYVRNDTFFNSIVRVCASDPTVRVVCVGMRGWLWAENFVARNGLSDKVWLTGPLGQEEMAQLYSRSVISVSVSEHDGTPNTLLEAMAMGCFPICGDLPSIREWIDDGVNGVLINPDDTEALTKAILVSLNDRILLKDAREANSRIVRSRAMFADNMESAVSLYRRVKMRCDELAGE